MKNIAFLFLAAALLFTSCNKVEITGDVPACIKKMIKENANSDESECDEVWEYDFQGSKVYAFEAFGIGGRYTNVYNEDCSVICSLSGFSGTTICNGDTFALATNPVLVWHR